MGRHGRGIQGTGRERDVIDLTNIAGCFPDVRCLASIVMADKPDISVILWSFLGLAVAAGLVGFWACNSGDRK